MLHAQHKKDRPAGASASPSSSLYATLKTCGISNLKAARMLLNTRQPLKGRLLEEIVSSRSQLSRRIVHASPGEIPASCFNDFRQAAQGLSERILERCAVEKCKGDPQAAAKLLVDSPLAHGHEKMLAVLSYNDIDTLAYEEALSRIELLARKTEIFGGGGG